MTTVRFYVVRHGETEWNVEGRLQGWGNSPLTLTGKQHTHLLAQSLSAVPFSRVVTSSAGRAIETARILTTLPIETRDDLREIHLGEWEGKVKSEIIAFDAEQYDYFWHAPERYVGTGETFAMVQQRLANALQHIAATSEGNVLIVSHAVAIKSLFVEWGVNTLENLWNEPFCHGTSVTIVEYREDGEVVVEQLCNIDHLPLTLPS